MWSTAPWAAAACAVSALALGTMTFGAETDEDGAHAQLDRFVEAGGNLVDTADVYTGGASEEIIGRWLGDRPADVATGSCWRPRAGSRWATDPNDVGLSRRHLTRALDASLRRLGVDGVDLYQVHAWDPLTPLEETLASSTTPCAPARSTTSGCRTSPAGSCSGRSTSPSSAACRAGHAAAAVQPAGPRDRVGDRAGRAGQRARPAAVVAARRRLADRQVHAATSGRPAPTRLGEDPDRGVEAYDRRSRGERTWDVVDAVRAVADGPRGDDGAGRAGLAADRPGRHLGRSSAPGRSSSSTTTSARPACTCPPRRPPRLDAASDPGAADYPYGGPGVEQRSRKLEGGW